MTKIFTPLAKFSPNKNHKSIYLYNLKTMANAEILFHKLYNDTDQWLQIDDVEQRKETLEISERVYDFISRCAISFKIINQWPRGIVRGVFRPTKVLYAQLSEKDFLAFNLTFSEIHDPEVWKEIRED